MKKLGWIALSIVLLISSQTMALNKPKGQIILKLTGNLNPTDGTNNTVVFDLAMLQALPQHEIVTSNPWVDEPHTYKGPKLADILATVGSSGKTVTLMALNNFQIGINWGKVKQYDPIVAWQDNGVTMHIRDKGPLWFILPLDQYPELKLPEYTDMMIWQLYSIDIQQ